MIPKIIHYCWLSNNPYPEEIVNCINSWKKYLPDYQLMLWNFDRFDIDSSIWVKQAYETKKYAFASDYLRLYSLYNYGGIYLDVDVEVINSFDNLLDLPYFIGEENTIYAIEAATIGAEKGCYWIKKCLDYYTDRKFILDSGKYNMRPLPSIMKNIFKNNYNIKSISNINSIQKNENEIYILSVDYFSPKKWDDPNIFNKTENTYSIHHFSGSWLGNNNNEKSKKQNLFSKFKYFICKILSK